MGSSSEDDAMENGLDPQDDLQEDLFGDEDEELDNKGRELSDRDLDSGDDEDRDDRRPEKVEVEEQEANVLEFEIWRHILPKPLDGEYNSLRLPNFLGIDRQPYDSDTFQVPESDHRSTEKSENFSASAIAASTMRFRRDYMTGQLESNTVVYRWSDGSTTFAVGDQHYEIQTKPLAPPKDSKPYLEVQDSHSYIGTPSRSGLFVTIGHMTNEYTVRPNKEIEDDALEKLQASLAAAARGGGRGTVNGPELIANTVDPELQKKRAEIAEKERIRLQRRRDTAQEKANQSRSGLRGLGGLSVDDLEGRGSRRAPGSGRKPPVKRQRRRADYDSDDDLPRGRTREDEYDKEDDFLASSDEELEEPEGDDDEEEEMIDDESDEKPKAKKAKASKQQEASDVDADAEADLDDEEIPAPAPAEAASRGRKRNIVEDDEDDE